MPVRQPKEQLRKEIALLYQHKRSSDHVFAALVQPDLCEDVLQRLRGGQSIESVSDWLGDSSHSSNSAIPSFDRPSESNLHTRAGMFPILGFARSTPGPISIMSVGGPDPVTTSPITSQRPSATQDLDQHSPWYVSSRGYSTRNRSHADSMKRSADINRPPQSWIGSRGDAIKTDESSESESVYCLDLPLNPLGSLLIKDTVSTWTCITTDIPLVQNLLALYFCWEYPTFASLSKKHFLKDFHDGTPRYCSPILVNALLALGCHFSTKPIKRATLNEPPASGEHFFKESQRLFCLEENHHSLTTVQALGIMSIREASCGRDSESCYYARQSIQLAIDMGLHRIHDEGDEDKFAVQAATFWGAFALDQ